MRKVHQEILPKNAEGYRSEVLGLAQTLDRSHNGTHAGKGRWGNFTKIFFRSIKKRHPSVLQNAQDGVFLLSGWVLNGIIICIFWFVSMGTSYCWSLCSGPRRSVAVALVRRVVLCALLGRGRVAECALGLRGSLNAALVIQARTGVLREGKGKRESLGEAENGPGFRSTVADSWHKLVNTFCTSEIMACHHCDSMLWQAWSLGGFLWGISRGGKERQRGNVGWPPALDTNSAELFFV